MIVAKGGRGGLGNEHFKSATNQTPREHTEGELAIDRTLRLELKLLADVGLVGLPNAGKSTFLRAVSAATPKVADYPFTTLHPHLGIATLDSERRLIIADIPGLIRGAADGAGLGHDFLRHLERTEVLLHLLDAAPIDGSDPAENYRAIRAELAGYGSKLDGKREIVVLNKADLLPADERENAAAELAAAIGVGPDLICLASGATGDGVRPILETCWHAVERAPADRWKTQRPGTG